MYLQADFKKEDLKELELALNAIDTLSDEAFEEFDRYKEEESKKDQDELDKLLDGEGEGEEEEESEKD